MSLFKRRLLELNDYSHQVKDSINKPDSLISIKTFFSLIKTPEENRFAQAAIWMFLFLIILIIIVFLFRDELGLTKMLSTP